MRLNKLFYAYRNNCESYKMDNNQYKSLKEMNKQQTNKKNLFMIDNVDWWIIEWTQLRKLIIHGHLSGNTQMLNQVGYAVHVKPDTGDFGEEQLERKSLCFAVCVYNKDNDVTLSSVTLSK